MSYETGPVTDHTDFFNKMSTFLAANGWTEDEHDTVNDEFAIHLTSGPSVFVSFRYDNTGNFSIHQALGFTGGNTPGNHTDDSGNGDKVSTITVDRRWNNIGAGPFTAYHFFTDDTSYAHIVLEYAPGLYRHMSFGQIVKKGVWTGGEYCGGHVWLTGVSSDDPTAGGHYVIADSRSTVRDDGMTMHIEGLPGEPSASTKWGNLYSGTDGGVDSAAVAREILVGGMRDSLLHRQVGHLRADPATGVVNLIPLEIWRRLTGPAPDTLMPLGTLPDIRAVNMHFFEPGQEFVIGPDTWKMFPWTRKRFLQDNAEESWNMGIAYKKIA